MVKYVGENRDDVICREGRENWNGVICRGERGELGRW